MASSLLHVLDAKERRRLAAGFNALEPRLRAAFRSGSERELLEMVNELFRLFGKEEEKFT